jgi:Ca2+-transporting ATPase
MTNVVYPYVHGLPSPFCLVCLSIVIMLIVASIASIALGEYIAAAVIIIIVLANAILGVVQETRAEAALDELKSVSAEKADVHRDGKRTEIAATELVPGDIVYLDMGCQIPVCDTT